MSCPQNNVFLTTVKHSTPAMTLSRTCSSSRASFVHMAALNITSTQTLENRKKPSMGSSLPKYKTCGPIWLFGRKGNSRGENTAFSWDSLKDALGGLRKEKRIQDILRDQMQQREIGSGEGGDGNPPGSGGGRSDGTEDEGFAEILDETVQVVFATLAFLFVYMYIIKGGALIMLARDYIRYLLGDVPSSRLKRIMDKWKRAFRSISWTPEESDDKWLVRSIVLTPTWWHRPDEIARVVKSRMVNSRRMRERS